MADPLVLAKRFQIENMPVSLGVILQYAGYSAPIASSVPQRSLDAFLSEAPYNYSFNEWLDSPASFVPPPEWPGRIGKILPPHITPAAFALDGPIGQIDSYLERALNWYGDLCAIVIGLPYNKFHVRLAEAQAEAMTKRARDYVWMHNIQLPLPKNPKELPGHRLAEVFARLSFDPFHFQTSDKDFNKMFDTEVLMQLPPREWYPRRTRSIVSDARYYEPHGVEITPDYEWIRLPFHLYDDAHKRSRRLTPNPNKVPTHVVRTF